MKGIKEKEEESMASACVPVVASSARLLAFTNEQKKKIIINVAHDNEQTGDSTLFNGLRFPGGKMKQAHFYLLPLCLPHSLGQFHVRST